jgi:hypothetical protein
MAKSKVKLKFKNKSFKKVSKLFTKKWLVAKSRYFTKMQSGAKFIIVDGAISKGRSPVKGMGRFKEYSESYKKQISSSLKSKHGKRKRPVNLRLKGDLHKSFELKKAEKGFWFIFTDKKASWHNDGVPENNLPARPILPDKPGQKFSKLIEKDLQRALVNIVRKVFKG